MNTLTNAREMNFDGLIGPTHHYGGLSPGNVASTTHAADVSRPREAALQGIAKMRRMCELGVCQGVLPFQPRPDVDALRTQGFSGADGEVLRTALCENPQALSQATSASAMWTANAATVSPSADTADRRVHLTAANLQANAHRRIESPHTLRTLRHAFGAERFVVHEPLPAALADEGAANHMQLTPTQGAPGIELFVYGRSADNNLARCSYPARQTRQACERIIETHGLAAERVCVWQQTAEAIDAGVFHNDVISVGNENVLLMHESAYVDQARCLDELRTKWRALTDRPLCIHEVRAEAFALATAVTTYLFNSQLVTLPDGQGMCLIAPVECHESAAARAVVADLLAADNPVRRVEYVDLRQSMRNGGGPACLRLRVVLTRAEMERVHPGYVLTPKRLDWLEAFVERRYPDRLTLADCADMAFVKSCRAAYDELTAWIERV